MSVRHVVRGVHSLLLAASLAALAAAPAGAASSGSTGQPGSRATIEEQLAGDVRASFDVTSGNFRLTSADVLPADDATNVAIVRSYNSLGGSGMTFAGGWTADLGPDVRIVDAGANAYVYGPSGYLVTLDRQADGSYAGPPTWDGRVTRAPDGSWTLADDGGVWSFDASGRLTTRADGGGNVVTVTQGTVAGRTRMTAFAPAGGESGSVTYDGIGRAETISLPGPSSVHYTYDSYYTDRLLTFVDGDGARTSYGYDRYSKLTDVIEPDGTRLHVSYQLSGVAGRVWIERVTRPDGVTVGRLFEYHAGSTDVYESTLGADRPKHDEHLRVGAQGELIGASGTSDGLSLAVSGTLRAAEGAAIANDAYPLHVQLNAGTESATARPVAIRLLIDDDVVESAPCSASGCAVGASWDTTLGYNDFLAGAHVVKVVATDDAGNEAYEQWRVTGQAQSGSALFRSAAAPERWHWATDMAAVSVAPDGHADLLDGSGTTVMRLPAPVAIDAVGRVLPASYTAAGNVLTLLVPHHVTGVVYPVTVKPNWAPGEEGAPAEGGYADYPAGTVVPFLVRSVDPTGEAPGSCRVTAYPDPYIAGLGEFHEGMVNSTGTAHCKRAIDFIDLTVCIQKQHHVGPFPTWENEYCNGPPPQFEGFVLLRKIVRHDCRPRANRHTWRTYAHALVDDVDGEAHNYPVYSFDRKLRC